MAKNTKIKKYRKPLNLNIGMIIFGGIFIYVIVCVIMFFQTSHIVRYEVEEGSLITNNTYRGVILREETVICNPTAGYINYYAREGERVAKNALVFIIDETGRLNAELDTADLGENSLSERELSEFRDEIISFVHGFDSAHYSRTYDIKHTMKNTVLKIANVNMLNSITGLNSGGGVVQYAYAPATGVVSYWTDGYEGLGARDVTEAVFDTKSGYEKKQMLGNSLMAAGDAAYKLCTSEDWSLVIPVEDLARAAQLHEEGVVKVRFLKNQYESWAEVEMLTNTDGKTYLKLDFNNSMATFINDRFLDVELILEDEKGLKIPVSSIVQKEFYLIPEDYVIPGGKSGGDSIMRQCFLEDGTISSEQLDVEVYYFDSDTKEYYLDSSFLSAGTVLYKLDSQETYTVSKRATLIGVYNMNKGYADFKQINILYQNDEYAIVKSNTKYGLNVYDYIVLNAEAVNDDQLINQ